jgi:FixJ family two-component response regulator
LSQTTLVAIIGTNQLVAWAAATIIRSADLAVTVLRTAEEFIRSDQMSCTACLVVDVDLPGMSGLQLQSHLAAAGRHIPIVFIAGSAGETALAYRMGAVNFLDKPGGEKALLKEVCAALKVTTTESGIAPSPGPYEQ